MEIIFKIAAGGIITVLLTAAIKSHNKELALALTLASCAIMLFPGLQMLGSIRDFVSQLREEIGLESAVLTPLVRVCAIGLVTQLSAYFCQDAGEVMIARVLELCGSIAAVCATLPLLRLVLDMLKGFLGG